MKLTTLQEMAAKKFCEKCGKTMAANHYWYKGGWRCKGASKAADPNAPATPAAVVPPSPATNNQPGLERRERMQGSPEGSQVLAQGKQAVASALKADGPKPTIEAIRKMIPELDKEDQGTVFWQTYEINGRLTVEYEVTFRRNTHTGAYRDHRRDFDNANAKLQRVVDAFPGNVVSAKYVTAETAKARDDWRESDGDSAYSEYEQSLVGSVQLKV